MSTPTLRARAVEWGITPRLITMALAALVTFVLMLVMLTLPVPFGVRAPGPVIDTLGTIDDEPLISVEGTTTYPTSGELQLTTVTTAGGPGFPVDAGGVLRGWFSTSMVVAPVEFFFDPGQSREEIDQTSTQQMVTSQQNATVAALTELGYDVPATLTIVGSQPGSGADGVVQDGDLITGIDGGSGVVEVVTFADLSDVLLATPPGSTVDLVVERDGESVALPILTGDDGQGGSILGVFLDGDFDYPVDVNIAIENVGGSSAGTMFALGIIDMLTPGEMTGGEVIAGTGTVSLGGVVGPIGGIQQKMAGARSAGAGYFIAPLVHCPEIVGHVPEGLQVVTVSTLSEARDAVEAIGADDAADLPSC